MTTLADSSGARDLEGREVALGRPPLGVPGAARWDPEEGEWRIESGGGPDAPAGGFRGWRSDGTLRSMGASVGGKLNGPLWRFHPNGSLQRTGCYAAGVPRGTHHVYSCEAPTPEYLQVCCVPPGAWHLRIDYHAETMSEQLWFDRTGTRLLGSGAPYPVRPPGVSPKAGFVEGRDLWEEFTPFGDDPGGSRRRVWSSAGVLQLVEESIAGKRHGQVMGFDARGALAWQESYVHGRLDGPSRALDLSAWVYEDPDIRAQEGGFHADQAVGVWRFLDASGAVRATRDLGTPVDESEPLAGVVVAPEPATAESWWEVAERLRADGRIGEAFVVAARATAASRDAARFARARAEWTMPLGDERAGALADTAIAGAGKGAYVLVDALKRGAAPAPLLASLATALVGHHDRVALDLVTAALVLAPGVLAAHTTRALIHAALGEPAAAAGDVDIVRAASPESGAMLDLYLRVYFPRFDFWPARVRLEAVTDSEAIGITRSVAEVRDVIQRYATRLARSRAVLSLRHDPGSPFMIPDLAAMLPAGPLTLARWSFAMTAEEYSGGNPAASEHDGESIEITVDEAAGLADEHTALLPLMRGARKDWAALTWLCWAVGLDAVGLPDVLAPRPNFGDAALAMEQRTWRCHDRLNTMGLLAMTKGIAGFDWEGAPIDEVPRSMIEVALDEHVEARAVFSWLCDETNRSPWQDDLRRID